MDFLRQVNAAYEFAKGMVDIEHRAYLDGINPIDIAFHPAVRNYIQKNNPHTPNKIADAIGRSLAIGEYAVIHPITSTKIALETPSEEKFRKRLAEEIDKILRDKF